MSINVMMKRASRWPAFTVEALLLSALPACAPEVPSAPTYTKDVQPILAAHCVRCHGANDMLNAMEAYGSIMKPALCYLDRYDDTGDCTTVGSTTCQRGAAWCASPAGGNRIPVFLTGDPAVGQLMPPPPSDSLNQWEIDVLTRWSGANPAR